MVRSKLKRLYIFSLTIFFISFLFPLFAKEGTEIGVDAGLFTGFSIVDLEGESFKMKAVPSLGVSLLPYIKASEIVSIGVEVSFQYSFKSDYSNFYYYDAYITFTLLPNISLLLQGGDINYLIFSGIGGAFSFSDYLRNSYMIFSFGSGIQLKKAFIKNISVSYTHSFINNFHSFETVKLYFTVHIWDKRF